MSNFIETFKQGKAGHSFGFTTGIPQLDLAINRIQRKTTIGVAAAPKVGKTKFVDFCFVLSPYLEAVEKGLLDDIEWIYWSTEIDRVTKEFNYAAFFMANDYKVYNFMHKGKMYSMDAEYLQGKKLHRVGNDQEFIPVSDEHEGLLKEIYKNRIIPLFGEWSAEGVQITPGKITFIEEKDNPTGMWKLLKYKAAQNGTFVGHNYTTVDDKGKPVIKERLTGYVARNPNKTWIAITDHMRGIRKERGFSAKENIDKWLEYQTEIRNLCSFTFIDVVHSNRNLANVDRLKFAGKYIFPTGDDTKDSGNFAEECTILMTLFNPNDEKYNLTNHFDVELKDFPNYRSIHITESRNTPCPAHIQTNMYGGINMFTPLINTLKPS